MKLTAAVFFALLFSSVEVHAFTLVEKANGKNKGWDTVSTPKGADFTFTELKISDDGNKIIEYYYSLTHGYKEYFKKEECLNTNGKIKCNLPEDYKELNYFDSAVITEKWPCLKDTAFSNFFDLDVNYSVFVKGVGYYSILNLLNKKECNALDISKVNLTPTISYGEDKTITDFHYVGFFNGILLFLFNVGHSPNWVSLGQYDVYQHFKGIVQPGKLINDVIVGGVNERLTFKNEQYVTLSKSGMLGTSAPISSTSPGKIDYCFLKQNEKTRLYEKIGCYPTIQKSGETEIYSVGISDNNKYLVMEWINGDMTSTVITVYEIKGLTENQ